MLSRICLLVVTSKDSVARWAAGPIALGGSNVFKAFVIGLKAMDPAKYVYQSEFARKDVSLGRAEARAEERADLVLKLLVSR